MCYVTVFQIAGLKIIISEKRWKGPSTGACEIMASLESRADKRRVKGIVSVSHKALVQSEHTKNDEKKILQSTPSAFVLPCALVNSGQGDKGLIPGECSRQDKYLPPVLTPLSPSSSTSLSHILQGIFMLPLLHSSEISILSWPYSINFFQLKVAYACLMTLFSKDSSATNMLQKSYYMLQRASVSLATLRTSPLRSLSATQCAQTRTQSLPCPGIGLPACGNHERNIQWFTWKNTSHFSSPFACYSGGNPGNPFLGLWDNSGSSPSLENTRWVGWRQFCRKCFESGFFSGLSSWKQSSQKALPVQPSFIASRAADGFPKHLKSARLPDT